MRLKRDTIMILVIVAVVAAVYWYTQSGGSEIAGTYKAAGYTPNGYNDGSAG